MHKVDNDRRWCWVARAAAAAICAGQPVVLAQPLPQEREQERKRKVEEKARQKEMKAIEQAGCGAWGSVVVPKFVSVGPNGERLSGAQVTACMDFCRLNIS